MNRKGFAAIIIGITVLVIIAAAIGYFIWKKALTASESTLQASEVSNLVTFLAQNNLQAAVVQKLYPPNNASVWLVKSDGEKILIYNKDLGTVQLDWLQERPAYDIDKDNPNAIQTYMTPDYAGVWDDHLNKLYDISSYITNFKPNPFWDSKTNVEEAYVNFPAGHYHIDAGLMRLDTVAVQNGSFIYNPIGFLPPDKELAWSVDGRYIVTASGVSTTGDLYLYDTVNSTSTLFSDKNLPLSGYPYNQGEDQATGYVFTSFIYPATLVISEAGNGTFAQNLNENATSVNILPDEVKMVGLIPATATVYTPPQISTPE